MWRIALLVAIPVFVWIITDFRYRYVAETAGGIHFIIKVDLLNLEKACLIVETAKISSGLISSLCKK